MSVLGVKRPNNATYFLMSRSRHIAACIHDKRTAECSMAPTACSMLRLLSIFVHRNRTWIIPFRLRDSSQHTLRSAEYISNIITGQTEIYFVLPVSLPRLGFERPGAVFKKPSQLCDHANLLFGPIQLTLLEKRVLHAA
jgi:hypothetical protein